MPSCRHRKRKRDRIEALKLVGDANVPRGRLTWRSARGQAAAPSWRMPISLQLRDDVNDDDGFWWSPDNHTIEWDASFDVFHLVGANPAHSSRARFHRVSAEEALEAASTIEDAP